MLLWNWIEWPGNGGYPQESPAHLIFLTIPVNIPRCLAKWHGGFYRLTSLVLLARFEYFPRKHLFTWESPLKSTGAIGMWLIRSLNHLQSFFLASSQHIASLFFLLVNFLLLFLSDFLIATSIKDLYSKIFECNCTSAVLDCKPAGLTFSLLLSCSRTAQFNWGMVTRWQLFIWKQYKSPLLFLTLGCSKPFPATPQKKKKIFF